MAEEKGVLGFRVKMNTIRVTFLSFGIIMLSLVDVYFVPTLRADACFTISVYLDRKCNGSTLVPNHRRVICIFPNFSEIKCTRDK